MPKTTKRLGRGLSSLVSAELNPHPAPSDAREADKLSPPPVQPGAGQKDVGPTLGWPAEGSRSRLLVIPLDQIRRNPSQPRRDFDQAELDSLAASMKACGTLQPVVVRHAESGYELVAGERRLRAARLAGMTEIPAIVRAVPDERLLELALVENIQRTDLNPIERARAYSTLREKYGLTHEQIGERVGEDRATVANTIRLLDLGTELQTMVMAGRLSAGHARSLLAIKDERTQLSLAGRVEREQWSVRRLEGEVAGRAGGRRSEKPARRRRPAVLDLEERLSSAVGTPVTIREGRRRHSGKIIIEYHDLTDFQRILERLGVDVEDR